VSEVCNIIDVIVVTWYGETHSASLCLQYHGELADQTV